MSKLKDLRGAKASMSKPALANITQPAIVEEQPLSSKEKRLTKAGATREAAYKALVEGLAAEVVVLDKFGQEHVYVDNPTRIRASELISKHWGDLKLESGMEVKVGIFNGVGQEVIDELLHMVKDVAIQLRELKGNGKQTGEILEAQVIEHGQARPSL